MRHAQGEECQVSTVPRWGRPPAQQDSAAAAVAAAADALDAAGAAEWDLAKAKFADAAAAAEWEEAKAEFAKAVAALMAPGLLNAEGANDCFLNTLVQCLYYCPAFRAPLLLLRDSALRVRGPPQGCLGCKCFGLQPT